MQCFVHAFACNLLTSWSQWSHCPRITCRLFVLALVAICRGCEVLVEQPGSSLMVHCPYVQFLALVIQPLRWAFARLWGSQRYTSYILLCKSAKFSELFLLDWVSRPFLLVSPLPAAESLGSMGTCESKTYCVLWNSASCLQQQTTLALFASIFFCILALFSKLTAGIGYNLTLLRSYLTDFKRRLTKRDHRRIQKNKAIKKHQMVRKSISKSGRVQVYLVVKKLFCFLQCNLGVSGLRLWTKIDIACQYYHN